jgi:AraC-like DNA-binding protein
MSATLYSRDKYFDDLQFPIRIFPHYAQKTTMGNHFHDFHELVIVQEGSGIHVIDCKKEPIFLGDVFVIKPFVAHNYTDTYNLQLENILFIPELLNIPDLDISDIPGYSALFHTEPKPHEKSHLCLNNEQMSIVNNIVTFLNIELITKRPGYRFMAKSYFMQIIGYLSRCYGNSGEKKSQDSLRISSMIDFIDANYYRPLKLADIARKGNMSISNVNRLFNETLKTTPIGYLIQVRIKNAMTMLERTSHTINEVSFMCGFCDSNYFTKQFKKTTGTTPSDFKQKLHESLKAGFARNP